MSVQTEIDRITNAVADSYDAVENMGGTLPTSQTVANLADAIETIPVGSPIDNQSITLNSSNQIQTVGVIDNQVGTATTMWTGTLAQYNAITTKDPNRLYYITDDTSVTPVSATDYVVEQGTSGIWSYRKWDSGVAECWGEHTWYVSSFTAWGSVYESNPATSVTYPTGLFISIPSLYGTYKPINTASPGIAIELFNTGSVTTSPTIYLVKPRNADAGYNYTIGLHAKGRWK